MSVQGKRFDVRIIPVEILQATYIDFYLSPDGSLQVPLWNYKDDRWESMGLLVCEHNAIQITETEAKRLGDAAIICYENDWYSWWDISMNLIENQ